MMVGIDSGHGWMTVVSLNNDYTVVINILCGSKCKYGWNFTRSIFLVSLRSYLHLTDRNTYMHAMDHLEEAWYIQLIYFHVINSYLFCGDKPSPIEDKLKHITDKTVIFLLFNCSDLIWCRPMNIKIVEFLLDQPGTAELVRKLHGALSTLCMHIILRI